MKKPTPFIEKQLATKLQSSGLTAKHAKALKLQIMEPAHLKSLGLPEGWSVKIPYFDPRGDETSFERYRYLEDMRSGFDVETDKKGLRYVQKTGTINEVYYPPLVDWAAIAKDVTRDIIITEGEFKAACGCAHGFNVIGLGGVWSFRSAKAGLEYIPALKWVLYKGRKVYVLFDSDAKSNADIRRAENALCDLLASFGAIPSIARLPDIEGQKKTGLDDFIVAQGAEAVAPILDNAEEWALCQALSKFNEELVYIENPSMVMRLRDSYLMNPRTFMKEVYAPETFIKQELNAKGETKNVIKQTAEEWFMWKQRSSVHKLTFAPGKPTIFDNQYNTWTGWGCAPKKGDVDLWLELMDHVFGDDDDARNWFEQWLAYPLQNPGVKMTSASVMWSTHHGTGKSIIGYAMGRIYGKHFAEIGEEHLTGNFNSWAKDRQFVMGDDVTGFGGQRKDADRLKRMISRRTIDINAKYLPNYEVPDCINYFFTSNQPDAFFVEDEDRRYFIHQIIGMKPQDFYKRFEEWLKNGGDAALFYYLLELDTSKFDPYAPALVTVSKRAMIEDSRSDLQTWVHTVKATPEDVLVKGQETIPYSLWRTVDLLKIFDPHGNTKITQRALALELSRAGFKKTKSQVRVTGGACRLWIVREQSKFLHWRDAQLGEWYNKERETNPGYTDPKVQKPVGHDLRKETVAKRKKRA